MTAGRRSTRTSHGAGAAEFIRARTRRDLPRTHGPMAPRGGGPDRQRRAIPGGADQAVRHLAGVLGARRRSGHPHRKTQAPGHRGPYTPNVIESLHAGACEAAHAGGADPGGHASPQEPRQNRPPPAAAHTQPASWRDRNRAEPDPMRAASRPEDMTATTPESALRSISRMARHARTLAPLASCNWAGRPTMGFRLTAGAGTGPASWLSAWPGGAR
jgi:hypothetical protein